MTQSSDPYRIPPGPGLDLRVHQEVFGGANEGPIPAYSTDSQFENTLLKRLRSLRSRALATGSTTIRGKTWYFARYGSDPSTSTEVLSESLSLSLCRLSLVLLSQD